MRVKRIMTAGIVPLALSLAINLLLFSALVILGRPRGAPIRRPGGAPIRLAPYAGMPEPASEVKQVPEAPPERQPEEPPSLEIPAPPQADLSLDMDIDVPVKAADISSELDLDVEVPELPPLPDSKVKIPSHKAVGSRKKAHPKRHRHPLKGHRQQEVNARETAPAVASQPISRAGQAVGAAPARDSRGESMAIEQVEVKPVLIHRVKPEYPLRARRRRITGYVVVKFMVDGKGRVQKAAVIEASPSGIFEQSALRAVRRWRFRPGLNRGVPVSVWIVQPIRFQMKSG